MKEVRRAPRGCAVRSAVAAGVPPQGARMLVGLNTFLSRQRPWGDLGAIYFRRQMDAIKLAQPGTRMVVLGDAEHLAPYAGCETIEIPPAAGGLGGLLRGGRAQAEAIEKAGINFLLSPLDAPIAGTEIPQLLYALDLAPWEPDPGALPGKVRRPDASLVKACGKARGIVVPSEHLRRRCAEMFDAPLDRIAVAPPGVTPAFQSRQQPFIEAPYLVVLVDALTAPHTARLREALVTLQKELPHTFVVVGPPLEAEEEPDHWGPRTVRIEQCPDLLLAGLYQHASLLVYPALHDGCGVRVLEALAAGVPIVVPKSGAIPEVAGDSPLYYNADSIGTMLQAVRRVVTEQPDQRLQRIRLGQRHASAQNTWDKCAWKLLNAIKRA